ncbi:MAG TPA: pyridoxal phosphate-dependent aminotransferase [Pirellulaceae bacterium]|nr:pyridoxal phosphate-dependent aminotransferase [Pirellulaceae bacterium]HMO91024.1 pyridoxal phosphate-dependent aminotransferase [Pirellulaceae bacterium]HMP68139.1 pyridoxal phosphate-dependent aminotransferase [Pirellulaceae bacterium]
MPNASMTMSAKKNIIADRVHAFPSGRIREVFRLAAQLKNPINLSIGQADFDVPQPIKDRIKQAIDENHNGYSQAQGIEPLRRELQTQIDNRFAQADRQVFVTSGTSSGLTLACLALINPGDEVIFFDPYFVQYPALVQLVGGIPVKINTYPDFSINLEKLESAINDRTKMIIINSPANPTGCCLTRDELIGIAEIARRYGLIVVSDEIYSTFNYDQPHYCFAEFDDQAIVVDGFSKSHAMAGLRLAFVHGPKQIIDAMIQLQQLTFVCAPHPVQWGGLVGLHTDTSEFMKEYRKKRDWLIAELSSYYEISQPSERRPGGAFYIFPKLPWGTGQEFFEAALAKNLIMIPGSLFSDQDSHFRLSYAASDSTLQQGIDVLKKLATR